MSPSIRVNGLAYAVDGRRRAVMFNLRAMLIVVAAAALLIAGMAVLVRVNSTGPALLAAGGGARAIAPATQPAATERRFTLRLGQGFRFTDGAVVVMKDDERADIVFKYLPPHVGGLSTRYNPVSQQVEVGMEPTLTAPMPLLLAMHIGAFDERPNLARTTCGDIASYQNQAPVTSTTRYVLLMNASGEQFLLKLDELEAPNGKYDDWRIGFTYEPVQLPLGLAGGKINKPHPGSVIFRDWYRSKMIVSVDLTTGREAALADGILPSTAGDGLIGYGDASNAYVIRDSSGKTLHTIRFNEQVLGPLLSPDGKRIAASVYRPGPDQKYGDVSLPGPAVLAAAVFDMDGREIVAFPGYDDAVWTPDGKKLIATGALYEPGLFEIDPATKQVRAIDAKLASPLQPSVAPDGKTIAFVTGNKVWLIDRDGQNLRQLFPDGYIQQRPVFSPDGSRVALIICNTMAYDMTGEVFIFDLKTKEVTPMRTSMGVSLVPDPSTRLNWIP